MGWNGRRDRILSVFLFGAGNKVTAHRLYKSWPGLRRLAFWWGRASMTWFVNASALPVWLTFLEGSSSIVVVELGSVGLLLSVWTAGRNNNLDATAEAAVPNGKDYLRFALCRFTPDQNCNPSAMCWQPKTWPCSIHNSNRAAASM